MKSNTKQCLFTLFVAMSMVSANHYVVTAEDSTPPETPDQDRLQLPEARWMTKGLKIKEVEDLLEAQANALRTNIKNLETEKKQLTDAHESLVTQNAQLTNSLTQKQDQLTELSAHLATARQQLESEQKSTANCTRMKDTLQQTVGTLEGQAIDLNTSIQRLRAEQNQFDSKKASLQTELNALQTELKDCKQKKFKNQQSIIRSATQTAVFITLKAQIKEIATLSPYSALTIAGIPVGNSRQLSECIGHALYALENVKGQPDQAELIDAASEGGKAFVRELGFSVIENIGARSGITQKAILTYQKTPIPAFLDNHHTTKQVMEKAGTITVALLRLAADSILDEHVWSKLS